MSQRKILLTMWYNLKKLKLTFTVFGTHPETASFKTHVLFPHLTVHHRRTDWQLNRLVTFPHFLCLDRTAASMLREMLGCKKKERKKCRDHGIVETYPNHPVLTE